MKKSGFFIITLIFYFIISCNNFVFPEETIKDYSKSVRESPVEDVLMPEQKDTEKTDTLSQAEQLFQEEAKWLFEEAEAKVAIATKRDTTVMKAPSIVSVITGQEIKNMGYRTFSDFLRTIPGYEILKRGVYGTVIPAVRGIESDNRIRVMLNGHFVNNPYLGESFQNFDDFPLENIEKIEIIRGPGSALYGENAFMGAINIITKDAHDINGVKVTSGYGSFDTMEGNIIFGEKFKEVSVTGMLHYTETNGYEESINNDFVTTLDNSFSSFGFPKASDAPGSPDDWRRKYIMNLKANYKDFYFEGFYLNKNRGGYLGIQDALTNETNIENNYVFTEIKYKKEFSDMFTIIPRIYYDQFDDNFFVESLPEDTTLPFDTNRDGVYETFYTYADGLIGNGIYSQKIAGAEIPVDIRLFDGNVFTMGMEFRWLYQTNIQYNANFNPLSYEPLDSLQGFSDTYPNLKETTRKIWSAYLQDVWDITETINLTLGLRFDEYSDFGSEVSPRVGVTWEFMENATIKSLYGRAFRAPNFREMYLANQPAAHGNESLDPETIDTYEIGLHYNYNISKCAVQSGINYFYNDIEDLISLRSTGLGYNKYDNYGDAYIHGIEFESQINIAKNNYLFMNYTFQDPNDESGKNLPFVAKHKGNFGVNVQPWKYINTNLSTFVSGKRYREEGDSRNDLPSYALLNFSLITKDFWKTMEIQGTVSNLLDKDYDDPGSIYVSDDLPRPGRTFFVGMSYAF
ncbi:MAG: TonB-dependent receptor [Planctomycetes bacterium]|nr:TonB-dependent receptor [Planctomycetota bacterium]